jgi:fluoride ion exporter CrcB/FEX
MGMLVAEKQRSFMTTPRHVVLFNALAGGGCGSLTTFSTWQSDALLGVVNLGTPVVVYLLTLLVGFCSFYMCLLFGSHLGALLRRFVLHPTRLDVGNKPSSHQNAPFPALIDWLLLAVLFLYGLATVAFVVLAALLPASRPFWLSLLFGAGGED